MAAVTIRLGFASALDRHERRREQGTPCVSVVVGSRGLALRAAAAWAELRGRTVIHATGARPAAEWVARLAEGGQLARAAVAWLSKALAREPEELARWLGSAAPFEVETLLDAVPAGEARAICRSILSGAPAGGAEPERVLAVLAGGGPVLVAAADAGTLDMMAAVLARLAEEAPGLTLVVAVESDEYVHYGRRAPESRAKALLRAGVIEVPTQSEVVIRERLAEAMPEASDRLAGSVRRLAADGASEELVERYVAAARAVASQDETAARSAAEQFLFERLESLSATAGRFALNTALAIPFGKGRAMEVDLWAEALGIAVEIDGYHHFQEPDCYRRDRRKDFALQKAGHLVVRVLSEDVVERLEEVLDLILEAVAFRARV